MNESRLVLAALDYMLGVIILGVVSLAGCTPQQSLKSLLAWLALHTIAC